MTRDQIDIVLIAAGWAAAAGVVGLLVGYRTRRWSFRWAITLVAMVAVVAVVAGVIGTANAMFLSDHDFGVVLLVCLVAGVVAVVFALVVGAAVVRWSQALQESARRFGESGEYVEPGGGPAELSDLSAELARTSERLRESREREQRIEESRRQLVAWVSHDLRSPLAGLRAMTESLEDGLADDPARYYQQMRSEVDRMVRMVDDLFELSRIHAGVLQLSLESVALEDVVSEAIAGADPVARAARVQLGGSVDRGVMVRADPAGLSRVVANLVMNAIRHTPADGVVSITGRVVDGGVELSVSRRMRRYPRGRPAARLRRRLAGRPRPHARGGPVTRHGRRPRPGHRQGDRRGPRRDGQGRERVPRLPLPGPAARMKVLVTGSAGFIGGAVCSALEEAGHEVVRVDLMLPLAHGTIDPPRGTHRLDVRDADAWRHLLDGVDVVNHQAAVVGAGVKVGDLPLYAAHNDLGTAALLSAMHDAGVRRLVLASSMVVYGEGRYTCPDHGVQVPPPRTVAALEAGDFDNHCSVCSASLAWALVDEEARLDPRSGYAASKVAQEHYTSAWVRQADAAAVALRYHNVYGPGMPRDTPYSGVAAMFRSSLERGERPTVYEDGGQMRDFVHVSDVAAANLAAVQAVDRGYRTYNVASGEPISIRTVAELVAGGTGSDLSPEVTGGFRLGDVRHVVASPERARAELGFVAEVAPPDGLRAFAHAPLR